MSETISLAAGIIFGGYIGYILAKYSEFTQYKLNILNMLDRHYVNFADLSINLETDIFDKDVKDKFTSSFIEDIVHTVYFCEVYFLRIGHIKAAWRARETAVAINKIIGSAIFRKIETSDWSYGFFKEEKRKLKKQLSDAMEEIRPDLLPLLCLFWRCCRNYKAETLLSNDEDI